MMNLKLVSLIVLLTLPGLMVGATEVFKLDQKKGLWEGNGKNQLEFKDYRRIEIDFDKMPLKYVSKIALRDDKIFILDRKRSELYVMNTDGKYLYTIGRPGQGPGDIEYGEDFCLQGGKVYVMNSRSKRISVFKPDGEAVELIKLDTSISLINPCTIAVDKSGEIYIGDTFGPTVSVFNADGSLKKVLITRKDMVGQKDFPPKVGIPPSLQLWKDSILHFDKCKGVITKIDSSGKVTGVYSAYRKYIRDRFIETIEEAKSETHWTSYQEWTDFKIDESGKIYLIHLIRKQRESCQELFVFSNKGNLLCVKSLDFFNKMSIKHFDVDKGQFVFLTRNFDLILVK